MKVARRAQQKEGKGHQEYENGNWKKVDKKHDKSARRYWV